MGKSKFIFLLILALVLVCGIVMVVDAPTSFSNSASLVPISDSTGDVNSSNCTNGTCLVDSNQSSSDSNNDSLNGTVDKKKDDKLVYDSKYYNDSFIEGLHFCKDLEKAFKDAKEHDRNVMIIFDGEACIYCEYLKDEGLTDPDIQKEINENDILLITETSLDPELSEQLQIHGTPTTVVFDTDGNELGRIVGYESTNQYLSELKECNGK